MPEENQAEDLSTAMTGAARSAETARALIRKTKRATRRRFPSEEKIRIVMEGVRGEISVAELCRREGIHPTIYYKWLKDFMEAGKARMRGDRLREATSDAEKPLLRNFAPWEWRWQVSNSRLVHYPKRVRHHPTCGGVNKIRGKTPAFRDSEFSLCREQRLGRTNGLIAINFRIVGQPENWSSVFSLQGTESCLISSFGQSIGTPHTKWLTARSEAAAETQ